MEADTEAFVDEGVIRFASATDANRYVARSKSTWHDCTGVVAHVVPDETW
jgi:PknH-like extracellular domain